MGPKDSTLLIIERAKAQHITPKEHTVRVETTRYKPRTPPDGVSLGEEFEEIAKIFQRRSQLVLRERVPHTNSRGRVISLWEHHWINPERRRQLKVYSHKRLRRPPRSLDSLKAVAMSSWQRKKPMSYPNERLWLKHGEKWEAWRVIVEAGHISHMAGNDVDLAYINFGNRDHFRVSPQALDPKAMRAWLESVQWAAQKLGGKVENVLMSRKLIQRLGVGYSSREWAKHPLSRLVRQAPGHDGHHHIRLSEETAKTRALALTELNARGLLLPALGISRVKRTGDQ